MKQLLFLLLFLPFAGMAQITQEIRKEIDVHESGVSNVTVVGDKGLITHGFRNEKGSPDVLEIVAYSTDFEQLNTKDIVYPKKAFFRTNVLSDNKDFIYFVFLSKKEIQTFTYSTDNYKVIDKKVALEQAFLSAKVQELNGKLFFSGTVKKVPTMLIYDPISGKQTYVTLPGINKRRWIESYAPDSRKESMSVFYHDAENMKLNTLYVFMIDMDGKMKSQPIQLDRDPKYSIIDGSITWINNTDFILAGSYGIKQSGADACGIYFSKWSGMTQTFITYHPFTEFENFFKYLPEKAQKKIEKKKKRREDKGKQEEPIYSRVASHPVLDLKDSYMFVGEVYYPTYRTETYTTYTNGKATTSTRRVFDGYQYSHAIVLGLDDEGTKLYDHCFSMYLFYKPYSVVRHLKITTKGNVTKLLYCDGSNIRAAFVEEEEMSEKDYGKIETDVEGDKVKWTGRTKTAYWYDNYYIIYGTQNIKNTENKGVDKKRTVFFLSKISYEN